MMKKKLIGLPMLSVLLVLLLGNGAPVSALASSTGEASAPGSVMVSSQVIGIDNDYVNIDVAYPALSGLKDAAYQDVLNRSLKEDMLKRISRMNSDAKAEYDRTRNAGYPCNGFELSSSVGISRNDGTLLCFSIRMEFYTGGAHPFPESEFYTILNTVPAKRLTLPDLFVDPAKGEAMLEKYVNDTIAKHPGEYFENVRFTAGNKTWFYLTDKELHIVFPAYSVACGAAGEPDMGFDLELFKDVLNSVVGGHAGPPLQK